MSTDKLQLGVILEGEVKKRFEAIKKYYGLQKNADLVRLLVTQKCEQLGIKDEPLPRFEQVNSDENGVKILDRQLHKVVDVTIARSGIKCTVDDTDDCEHIAFALVQNDIKRTIRQHRKEGWKLPDV
jgi:hypothetical protein